MKLSDIKRINQRIYTLDTEISRNSKVIFVAALVICLTRNKDFRNSSKLTQLIDFNNEKTKPIDQLIELASNEIDNMGLQESTKAAVKNSFKLISGVNTNLDRDRYEFQRFIAEFISNDFASIQPTDLFFENLYMEIDKKASKSDTGIVLTPIFIAQLMVDLAEIDYKKMLLLICVVAQVYSVCFLIRKCLVTWIMTIRMELSQKQSQICIMKDY